MPKIEAEDIFPHNTSIFPAIEKEIQEAICNGHEGALLYISIDNLPMIISGHGDEFAEETIKNLIKEIDKFLNNQCVIQRVDINHLNVILTNCKDNDVGEKAIEIYKLIQNYGSTNSLEPIQLAATIGSVDFPLTSKTAKDAVNKAYIALHDAKEAHKRYEKFKNIQKHEVESRNQMILASYMQNAFLSDKLCLAFQPIVNSSTGDVEYYESLLRIVNSDGSTSSAGPFIPIAEKMGFIDVIDSMVLKMVVDELYKSPNVKLSLNLSNASMYDSVWLDMATNLLSNQEIASRLVVEITETSEQHNIPKVLKFISKLHAMGCQIALDDFGTGYTSFSQLKSFPVDIIKIDGSFVRDIVTNPESKFFVKTLLEFSNNFGLKTVAEFVENGEIAEVLRDMKVDYMQGNYFSPAVNYRDWLNKKPIS